MKMLTHTTVAKKPNVMSFLFLCAVHISLNMHISSIPSKT